MWYKLRETGVILQMFRVPTYLGLSDGGAQRAFQKTYNIIGLLVVFVFVFVVVFVFVFVFVLVFS